LVQVPVTNETLFFSRVVGVGDHCMERNSSEGIAYLLKEDNAQKKYLKELRGQIDLVLTLLDAKGLGKPDERSTRE
jgi:hypothetical protein